MKTKTGRAPRHRAPGRASGPLSGTVTGRQVVSALGVVSVLATGPLAPEATGAKYTDTARAQIAVAAATWNVKSATSICVIWSNETRSDAVFTIASHAPLGERGWTNIVDKRTATSINDLAGCNVVMVAGEAWGVLPESRTLALAWFNAGGAVLTTGNDTGHASYPLPELVGSIAGSAVANYPYGGSVPATAYLGYVSPAYPSWTPGAPGTYELDPSSRPITAVAAGAVTVGTVSGHPEWAAAVARTNPDGGRWVHLHTKIGSVSAPGDVPAADAALVWLTTGRL